MIQKAYIATVAAVMAALVGFFSGQPAKTVDDNPFVSYSTDLTRTERTESRIESLPVVVCPVEETACEAVTVEQSTEEVEMPAEVFVAETEAAVFEEEAESAEAESKNNKAETTAEATQMTPKDQTDAEETAPVFSYTEDDLFYLAAAVCREAGGSDEEIQLLVANVIINRVNHSIYPNTIREVLTQKCQYGTMWKDGISFPSWADEDVKDQCYSVVQRILDGERVCPETVLFQAEFKQGSSVFKEFDGYYFCYYE